MSTNNNNEQLNTINNQTDSNTADSSNICTNIAEEDPVVNNNIPPAVTNNEERNSTNINHVDKSSLAEVSTNGQAESIGDEALRPGNSTLNEKEPFDGQLKVEIVVKSNNNDKLEHRYFGTINITGVESLVSKIDTDIKFYFALQVWKSNNKILEVRQGEVITEKWIILMFCHEPDNSDRCSVVFVDNEWFHKNRELLSKTG